MTDDDICNLLDKLKVPEQWDDPLLIEFARAIEKATLEATNARIATLTQTLREIANADTVAWDDRSEFEEWAKGRARHTLGETK